MAGRGASAATMTPYDVAAVRLADGTGLTGTPPSDVARYLEALRADRSARAVALAASGTLETGPDAVGLVERLAEMTWTEAEARARAAGALLGAYPAEV